MSLAFVTGGAGLVGSHACERLLHLGYEVVCLDDLSTGSRENVAHLTRAPGFTFVTHDVVQPLPPLPPPSVILHLASPASPVGYTRLPIHTLRTNSEGTRRVLELARECGATLLYASTSEVYGDPLEHPQSESYRGNVSTTGPRSMYDEAKRFGEALVMAFVRSHGVDARIVRLFNTYGPRAAENDGRLVSNFIVWALRCQPIVVYGDGQQTRSLCYVEDTVDGLVRAATTPGLRGAVMNIGNPDERTVRSIAETVRALVGSRSPLVTGKPMVGDDPQRRCPDITRAKALLGWEPRTPLCDGLGRTIAYFSARQ